MLFVLGLPGFMSNFVLKAAPSLLQKFRKFFKVIFLAILIVILIVGKFYQFHSFRVIFGLFHQ